MSSSPRLAKDERSLMEATAELLGLLEAFGTRRARAAQIVSAFARLPGGLVRSVIEFRQRENEPFVPIADAGAHSPNNRQWRHWPLERLIVREQAACIHHPILQHRALAFPLITPAAKSVIVAILADRALTPEEEAFIRTLEHVRAWSRIPEKQNGGTEPLDPTFVSVGSLASKLAKRAQAVVEQRGWRITKLARLTELWDRVSRRPPDVVLLDSEGADPSSILRNVRLNANALQLPVVVFCETGEPTSELQILSDAVLTPDATDRDIFAEIKRVLRAAPEYRERQLNLELAQVREALSGARGFRDIVEFAADEIAMVINGFAAVHVIDPRGRTFSAERGAYGAHIFTHIPEALLHEGPSFAHPVTAKFIETLTVHEDVAQAFSELGAISAASVPLIWNEEHFGTVLAATLEHVAEPVEWQLVVAFAKEIARSCVRVAERQPKSRPELTRIGAWKEVHDDPFTVLFCDGEAGRLCWRFIRLDDDSLLVRLCERTEDADHTDRQLMLRAHTSHSLHDLLRAAISRGNGPSLAGMLSAGESFFAYLTHDVPTPLLLGANGPAGFITSTSGSPYSYATIHLNDDTWIVLPGDERAERVLGSAIGPGTTIHDVIKQLPVGRCMILRGLYPGAISAR